MRALKSDNEKPPTHPYLSGNFAPVGRVVPLTPCSYEGRIPVELAGGQYVRNGGNALLNEELGRDYHWFDGDGMLSGVFFRRSRNHDRPIDPCFVNQFILTDLYLFAASSPDLRSHIVPSVATLVNPATTLLRLCLSVLRTLFLVLLSHLPGSNQAIKRISVTNTGLFYHDGRALATCESGPPIRVQLPELETVGWFNGDRSEGEGIRAACTTGFGGAGFSGFLNEWTTGHPKIDPKTGELVLFHSTFVAPYVHYSTIPAQKSLGRKSEVGDDVTMFRVPVPGVSGPRLMHDFGVSAKHTVIMDLPLTLDPFALLRGKPIVSYERASPSRFGVFPRYDPSAVRWFETDTCCIFHTANTWDETSTSGSDTTVNFLACRLTSPAFLFAAGNLEKKQQSHTAARSTQTPSGCAFENRKDRTRAEHGASVAIGPSPGLDAHGFERAPLLESCVSRCDSEQAGVESEEEQCCLFYYQFDLDETDRNTIRYQFALSNIPFEFPTVHPAREMSSAQYVYGCSTSTGSFSAALGRSVKVDTLVKVNVLDLIAEGKHSGYNSCASCVDGRTMEEILRDNLSDPEDRIQCFRMPHGWYAQEARLVPKADATCEDDGYLLFYAFDESQLGDNGECIDGAVSELWILDAKTMRDVVCRIRLPQRVPYGFHGNFFTEQDIANQRPVSSFRAPREVKPGLIRTIRDVLIRLVA